MTRLTLPAVGTVVELEGDLEDRYRAAGWVDVPAQRAAAPEKPKTRRNRKND